MFKHIKLNLIPIVAIVLSYFLMPIFGYDRVIIGLFGFFVFYFLLRLNKDVSIIYLLSILAIFQWLIGAVVYYSDLNPGMTFQFSIMQVGYEKYFQFAFPGTLVFLLGLNLLQIKNEFLNGLILNIKNNIKLFVPKAKAIIIGAVFLELFAGFVPMSLAVFYGAIVNLKYAGLGVLLIDFLITRDRKSLLYLTVFIILILIGTLKSLMFGELVFSFALIIIVIAPFIKISLIKKIGIMLFLGTLVVSIQLLKMPARFYMKKNEDASVTELVNHLRTNNFISYQNVKSEGFLGYSIARFNQGSIISWVMNRVPKKVPFENGKTVVAAVVGSFIPRIIWPSKPEVGSAKYMKYTGLKAKGTSFGISPLGEAYVNFGLRGGVIFMFFLGLSFSLILNLSILKSQKHLFFYWLLPIIFLHGLKVETDLTRSIGSSIRFLIVIGFFNWMVKQVSSKSIY